MFVARRPVMKPPARLLIICFLSVACTNTSKPNNLPNGANTNVPARVSTVQPTEIPLPVGLTRASTLLGWMTSSGLTILSVQNSIEGAHFQSHNQAAWIKTDRGIVDLVFFLDPAETDPIQVTVLQSQGTALYLYKIQAPFPTMSHEDTIDAAYPLYFTVQRGMFIVTSIAELDKALKRILAEH